MPGIAGIITKIGNGHESKNNIELMIKRMLHEKYYSSGTYLNGEMGVSVGWVCHKGSFSDCLPIWNERKNICLIFSGENFIDESEVLALKARGHQFSSADASYIVHLYEEMGVGIFEKLNGSFSGLLIDFNENKIQLFNDRYGLGRIYYHENDKGFYFSSEAKSILSILPELRELDISRLAELFSYGCTLNNKSIFSKISLLPGGSRWSFYPHQAGNNEKNELYFRRENWENLPRLNEENYYEKFIEIFPNLLKKYFQGNQKIAVSLTGGIDTRMIMAWAPCLPFKVPCYTFGGIYRDCADVKIARKVASACQQRHETIRMNKDFFSEFPALAKRSIYYSDGAMDISGSVELYMNRKAREIAPVRLTGAYGDQVLRNIIGFKPFNLYQGIFDQEFARHMSYVDKSYDPSNENPLSFFSFKQVPWHHYPRHALEKSQLTIRSPFLDNDLVALAYQAPDLAKSIGFSLRLIAEGDPSLVKIATDRGMTLKPIPIVGTARRLYQAFTIKAEYAYDYGMPQWLTKLDNAFATLHLENLFLGRHKFYHFRIWYRNELSKYVKDVILDPRTLARPYFQRKNLEKMVNNHMNGLNNYTQEIHWVLTSELIQRNLIEKK
jgi:asparagine synthase (glutamine-hydrolysing)